MGEIARLIILTAASAWMLLFLLTPLLGTFIPLIRMGYRPSWVLFWRLVVRAHLLAGAGLQALFSANRLWPGHIDVVALRWLVVALWAGAAISMAGMALTHPAGARGL